MLVKNSNTTVTGTSAQSYLGIRPEDVRKITSVLIDTYKSRVTPVREVIINGLETTANAVKAGREFRPVEIALNASVDIPERYAGSPFATVEDSGAVYNNAVITITDHGEGMSPEFMTEMFTSLGASTKDQDQNAVGGFGIGSKSVLSLTDYATWRTVKDGVATVMVISNDNERGYAINRESTPTEDENGTTVIIPVESDVMAKIVDSLSTEFLDYVPSDQVIVTGDLADKVTVGAIADKVTCVSPNGVKIIRGDGESFGTGRVHLTVNGAPYPVPEDVSYIPKVNVPVSGVNENLLVGVGFNEVIVDLDQNEDGVTILGSREALVQTDKLNDLIRDHIHEAFRVIVAEQINRLTSVGNLDDLMELAAEIADNSPIAMDNVLDRTFRFSPRQFTGRLHKAMSYLAGSGVPSDDGSGWGSLYPIVDAVNGRIVSVSDVLGSGDAIVAGTATVQAPSSDDHLTSRMSLWQRKLNESLVLSTTDNMGTALINAKSIKDLAGEDAPRFFTRSSAGLEAPVSRIARSLDELNLHVNGMEPDDFAEEITREINSRVVLFDGDIDDVREAVKTTIRKKNAKKRGAPRRRTEQEKIEDAPIHVMSYREGSYQIEDYFPSVPKLSDWLEKNDANWVLVLDDGATRYRNTRLSTVLSMDSDRQETLSQVAPDLNLRLVVVRRHTLENRVSEVRSGYRVNRRYDTVDDIIDTMDERARINRIQKESGLSSTAVEGIVEHAKNMVVNEINGKNLLQRLMDEFTVKDEYRAIMDTLAASEMENSRYYSPKDHEVIARNISRIAEAFVDGDYLIGAAYIPTSLFQALGSTPLSSQGSQSCLSLNGDAVSLLRHGVEMVRDVTGTA